MFTSVFARRSLVRGVIATLAMTSGTAAVCAAPAGAATPAATVASTRATAASAVATSDADVASRLTQRTGELALGSAWSGRVVSADGKVIWQRSATTGRAPGSNQKLVTAYVALRRLGPSRTLTTPVKQSRTSPSRLYLRGSGDPTLSTSRLRSAAYQTSKVLKKQKRTKVFVHIDDTLFPKPTNATGWKASYVPGSVAPVRALVVDGRNSSDTSMDAGWVFAQQLGRYGISVTSVTRAKTPSRAITRASTTSPNIGTMTASMLRRSDNDYAEALWRLAAKQGGYATTWSGARSNALAVLKSGGIYRTNVRVNDGSGLSVSNRLTARTTTDLLRRLRSSPAMRPYVFSSTGLPVAGVSGTLTDRFTGVASCARGKVQAKSGTLNGITALSGEATAADGRRRTFAFLVTGVANEAAVKPMLDELAAIVQGCR
ncbi:D-alanyl-D-alanine carboxypeptidase/D-alanyl-D-alanine endopeptidase [Kribbia dieselivorans]|uniref:D-alanyl-D-alanine carboxypeptidase/D-alanyl-D-alanine endopeptidase n=1 Tax=Kribbia dieselivorans TaxID=331526 RepID=UPI0008388EAD|nr:D-alanyl-D-alanine carboxypeptidase/D-alanyl-D-alanine-endopeptidase [Kribbia dieselivorans]